jgi:hypothetical protein
MGVSRLNERGRSLQYPGACRTKHGSEEAEGDPMKRRLCSHFIVYQKLELVPHVIRNERVGRMSV